MNLETLLDTVPGYAKDLKLNFSTALAQPAELTPQQAWGAAVASAYASGNQELLSAITDSAAQHLSPQELDAAKGAAAIMGMNNVFYRFLHLTSNEKYRTMPARLRMNIMRTHGVSHEDFELWCTAVSAINGCGACVDSHEKTLRDKGVAEEKILAAVRIASIVHALARSFDAEKGLESPVAAALPEVTFCSLGSSYGLPFPFLEAVRSPEPAQESQPARHRVQTHGYEFEL